MNLYADIQPLLNQSPSELAVFPEIPSQKWGVEKCVENLTMSGVAAATGNSWIKISTYIETVHIPSRKQNVLIPPPEGLVSLRVAD